MTNEHINNYNNDLQNAVIRVTVGYVVVTSKGIWAVQEINCLNVLLLTSNVQNKENRL